MAKWTVTEYAAAVAIAGALLGGALWIIRFMMRIAVERQVSASKIVSLAKQLQELATRVDSTWQLSSDSDRRSKSGLRKITAQMHEFGDRLDCHDAKFESLKISIMNSTESSRQNQEQLSLELRRYTEIMEQRLGDGG